MFLKQGIFLAVMYVNMLACFIMCKKHHSQREQHNHALRLHTTKLHLLLLQSRIFYLAVFTQFGLFKNKTDPKWSHLC